MDTAAYVGSEEDSRRSEFVSPTQHGTNGCALWTLKILREGDRKRLFFEDLPHAVYALPHLILMLFNQ